MKRDLRQAIALIAEPFWRFVDSARTQGKPNELDLVWGSDADFFWRQIERFSERAFNRRIVAQTPNEQRAAAKRLDAIESLETLFPRGGPPALHELQPSSAYPPSQIPAEIRLYEVVRDPYAAYLAAVPEAKLIHGLLVVDLNEPQLDLVAEIRARIAGIRLQGGQ